ncbi:MAG: hypothetical protein SFY69_09870 [Planctomycetota bacterium]|nr:hypothetical protein [Planctomycetota bacterium]
MTALFARSRSARALLALSIVALPALAAPPAILDRVPANAPMIMVTRDLQEMTGMAGQAMELAQSAGEVPGLDLYRYVDRLGNAPGVDGSGSMAVVMLTPPDLDDPGMAPDIVVLAPVTDYAALVAHFGGDAASPVTPLKMGRREMFARKIDDRTALLGGTRAAVEAFKVAEGAASGHLARMGQAGRTAADTADVLVVIDVASYRPQMEQFAKGMMVDPDAGQMAMQLGGMGASFGRLAEAMSRDGKTGVLSVTNSEAGLAIEMVGVFTPESPSATMFGSGGDSGALLDRLPDQPFYVAMAADFSNPGIRAMFAGDGQKAEPDADPLANLGAMLADATGMGMVVGTNPNGPLAGLLVNTSAFIRTPEPAKSLAAFRGAAQANKERAVGGTTVKTDYKTDVAQINGVSVDAWSTQVIMPKDDPNAFMAGMVMQTLFGQSKGFSQMAAATDTGLVMTMSQNTPLVTKSIQAAKSGEGLGRQAAFAQIRDQLPKNRMFEMYVGMPGIMEFVQSTLEEMLGEAVDLPKDVPLIGMGAGASNGEVSMRLFLPAKAMEAIGQAMQQWEGGDDFEPVDAPAMN